jgi:hypothetical protein
MPNEDSNYSKETLVLSPTQPHMRALEIFMKTTLLAEVEDNLHLLSILIRWVVLAEGLIAPTATSLIVNQMGVHCSLI